MSNNIERMAAELIAVQVVNELVRATEEHGTFNSFHEGYAVLLEEIDEVWEEIKRKQHDPPRINQELIQVAAMAMRMILDCS